MPARKLSRREVLKLVGTTTVTGTILAACGGAPTSTQPTQAPANTAAAVNTTTPANTATTAPVATAAAAGPAKIVLMYNANEISDAEIADFNKQYAPLKLERIDTDLVKFFSMVAAGTQVDGIRLQGPNIPAYVTKNVCLDLTDFFANSQELKLDDLMPVNDLFVYKGKRYGMVKDWSPDMSIFINKKLWAAAGVAIPDSPTKMITYQEWRDMSGKLTKKQGDQIII